MYGKWNSLKTVLLLGALTGLFLLIGSAIGGQTGMLIALLLATAINMGAWWFSDKMALRMTGAREVSPADAPHLHRMVEQLALRAQIPKPRVYIIESDMPNAFATGRSPSKGAVAVTTGIQNSLQDDELAGVIAHELAHFLLDDLAPRQEAVARLGEEVLEDPGWAAHARVEERAIALLTGVARA
ncbi:MAG: M48 family metalloprotease, partial [Caldilineaceae bacterium]|nr:M48 family metalloprotease [Caldilineaceae bacterium]